MNAKLYALPGGLFLAQVTSANACTLIGEAADRANAMTFAILHYFEITIALVAVLLVVELFRKRLPLLTVLCVPLILVFHPLVAGPPMCGYGTTWPSELILLGVVAALSYSVLRPPKRKRI
jgi:hypothetical protein